MTMTADKGLPPDAVSTGAPWREDFVAISPLPVVMSWGGAQSPEWLNDDIISETLDSPVHPERPVRVLEFAREDLKESLYLQLIRFIVEPFQAVLTARQGRGMYSVRRACQRMLVYLMACHGAQWALAWNVFRHDGPLLTTADTRYLIDLACGERVDQLAFMSGSGSGAREHGNGHGSGMGCPRPCGRHTLIGSRARSAASTRAPNTQITAQAAEVWDVIRSVDDRIDYPIETVAKLFKDIPDRTGRTYVADNLVASCLQTKNPYIDAPDIVESLIKLARRRGIKW